MNEREAINILIEAANKKRNECISRRKSIKEIQKFIERIRSEVVSLHELTDPLKEWGIYDSNTEQLFAYLRSKGKDFIDTDSSVYQRFLSSISDSLIKKETELQEQLAELDKELSVVSKYADESSIVTNLKSLGELIGMVDLPAEVVDNLLVTIAKVSIQKHITAQSLKAELENLKEECDRILAQKEEFDFVADDERFKEAIGTYSPEVRERVMALYEGIKRDLMRNYENIAGNYSYLSAYFESGKTHNSVEFLSDMLESLKTNMKANEAHLKRYNRIMGIEPCVISKKEEVVENEEIVPEVVSKEKEESTPVPVVKVDTSLKDEVSEEEEVEIPDENEESMGELTQDVVEILGNSLYQTQNEREIFENYKNSIVEAKKLLATFESAHVYLPENGRYLLEEIKTLKDCVEGIVEMRADNELFGGPKEDLKDLFGGIIRDIDTSIEKVKQNLDYCLEAHAIPQRVYDMFFPPLEPENVDENNLEEDIDDENVEDELNEEFEDFGNRNMILFLKDGEGRFCFDLDLQKLARKKDANLHDSVVKAFQSGLKTMTNLTYEELKSRNTKVRDITGVSDAVKKKYDPKRVREGVARISLTRIKMCKEVKQKLCELYDIKPDDLSRIYLVGGVMLKEGDKGSTSYGPLIKEFSNRGNQKYIDYLNKLFSDPNADIDEINKLIGESGDACKNLRERYLLG